MFITPASTKQIPANHRRRGFAVAAILDYAREGKAIRHEADEPGVRLLVAFAIRGRACFASNAEDVHIGMKVTVEWTEIQDGWVLPNFRKA